ncbi:MAG: HAMP domain-containing histidine kinase [Oscillospiraceae bacterium]|nr:HAMP domain-containing histidine kinase [Oscillospiraceae bacterium]
MGTVKADRGSASWRKKWTITGIQRRWMFNSLLVTLLIIAVAVGIFSVSLYQYYYNSMRAGLEAKVQTATDFFSRYDTREEYLANAASYTYNFAEKDRLELQFLSATGRIQYSSYGLTTGTVPGTADITNAINHSNTSVWVGPDPDTGERIMAVSGPAVINGNVIGVIRYVTSLKLVDRQITLSMVMAGIIGIALLAVVYLSNLYFIRSIIRPVAELTEVAERIASGSYGVQIKRRNKDEIGQLTDAINNMSLKISQTEKMKSEFLSSVSHELRTPLTAITGWSEILGSGELKEPEDIQKGLSIIQSETSRLTKMVEELLEFSRIEGGRFTLHVEDMDLREAADDAVYTYREFFRKQNIQLYYEDGGVDNLPISGDPERLQQVFANVLDNAAKHGGANGRVDVSLAKSEEFAYVNVRDYGPGIPPEELEHVKSMFYKGSSKARGSGIGLAVCEEIVTRHNGTLTIGNALGGGTIVTIAIPLRS